MYCPYTLIHVILSVYAHAPPKSHCHMVLYTSNALTCTCTYVHVYCNSLWQSWQLLIMLCNWLKELLQSQINCLQLYYIIVYSPQAKMQKPTFRLSLPKGQWLSWQSYTEKQQRQILSDSYHTQVGSAEVNGRPSVHLQVSYNYNHHYSLHLLLPWIVNNYLQMIVCSCIHVLSKCVLMQITYC